MKQKANHGWYYPIMTLKAGIMAMFDVSEQTLYRWVKDDNPMLVNWNLLPMFGTILQQARMNCSKKKTSK